MVHLLALITANAALREQLQAILGEAGYRVTLAEDAAAGEALVRECAPDLVLLDARLPGGEALPLCRRLKALEGGPPLPVILLLGIDDAANKESALTHGADDFLTTPLFSADVSARVQALLHVRTIRHDLHRTLAYLRTLEFGLNARWAEALTAADARPPCGRVLLVDDEAVSRHVHESLLAEQGFEVMATDTGEAALSLVTRSPVDVAVLDIVMPGLSGLDVLGRLRALDPSLPVVMLTAHVSSQYAIAALRLGASDFIVKGQETTLLLLAVDRALRQRREREATAREIATLRARLQQFEARALA